jgi:uncharacterized protein YgiM (DUF1202 family)
MRRTKKQLRRAKRYYGMVRIREGEKMVWLSQQNKHGWSLGLAMNKRTIWLRNVRFQSRKDVTKAIERGKLVFIHLKNK